MYGTGRRKPYTLNPTLKIDENGDVIDEKHVVVDVDVEDDVSDRLRRWWCWRWWCWQDWVASGDNNGDDNFDVDKDYVVADVGSGEYFDAHDVDDSDDSYGD
jgi:hypothetical protein